MTTDRSDRGTFPRAEIHVGWLSERNAWLVTHGGKTLTPGSFRRRAYAIAFARAIAASRDAEMVVRDANGEITRHQPGTLSYPTKLD
ncbi:DUF2188 domain-containing protein [Hyphomicrobium sp.]|mgnify:FL=1|uniref:DUF2188 domain-containing protein n=1 Tax=Hyphomicrobium sp. TaxID=82 RepID=UPI002B58C639|nr:DUF2188 domain-containing protein [Hyphomicrobium sp.]HRN87423.1 DUF2188 domain-containing protein [Hyphomicrobium sp.]HRQ26147.1 DUF2188 domain-containing protein [Hyphomicrobium sp.]